MVVIFNTKTQNWKFQIVLIILGETLWNMPGEASMHMNLMPW
jgi:hypothetical protein